MMYIPPPQRVAKQWYDSNNAISGVSLQYVVKKAQEGYLLTAAVSLWGLGAGVLPGRPRGARGAGARAARGVPRAFGVQFGGRRGAEVDHRRGGGPDA